MLPRRSARLRPKSTRTSTTSTKSRSRSRSGIKRNTKRGVIKNVSLSDVMVMSTSFGKKENKNQNSSPSVDNSAGTGTGTEMPASFSKDMERPIESSWSERGHLRRKRSLIIKEVSTKRRRSPRFASKEITSDPKHEHDHQHEQHSTQHSTKHSITKEQITKSKSKSNSSLSSQRSSTLVMPSSTKQSSSTNTNINIHKSSILTITKERSRIIPDGVTDLYPRNHNSNHLNHCSPKAVTDAFLSTYGWEHSQMLKSAEDSPMTIESPSTFMSSSPCSPSPTFFPKEKQQENTTTILSTFLSLADADVADDSSVPSLDRSHSMNSFSSSSTLSSTAHVVGRHVYREMDYMGRQPHLTPKMRAILMDWLIELAEEYKLHPTTLHLAATLVDHSLACRSDNKSAFVVAREMLQCLGCSCMWIASKMEEVEPPSVHDFVYISDNSYTKENITNMELSVCSALQFRLQHVTPHAFVHEFLRASHASTTPNVPCHLNNSLCLAETHNPVLESMVLYLLELTLLSYELVTHKPSLVTAAAVYLARATLGIRCPHTNIRNNRSNNVFWPNILQHYTGYDVFDLEETVFLIHKYQTKAEESELKSVHAKYTNEKYKCVGLKTVLSVDDLGF